MIRHAAPLTLLALGLVAAPMGADEDRRQHRVVIHDDAGDHVLHLEWDEDEFEEEMERFAERMERFGEHMGRLGERIGRDVERAMEDVDWEELERDVERHHRHHGRHDRQIHIHGDHLADVVEGSIELSLAAVFEALRSLEHLDLDVHFDDEAFERDMDRLDRELERLDDRMGRDLDDAMEDLEREMERLEEELERSQI
jgi:hypothetical protein